MASSPKETVEEPRPRVVAELTTTDYVFKVKFPDAGGETLTMDEPPPLGNLAGPNASRVLAAAIANCLSASLLYCLRRRRST